MYKQHRGYSKLALLMQDKRHVMTRQRTTWYIGVVDAMPSGNTYGNTSGDQSKPRIVMDTTGASRLVVWLFDIGYFTRSIIMNISNIYNMQFMELIAYYSWIFLYILPANFRRKIFHIHARIKWHKTRCQIQAMAQLWDNKLVTATSSFQREQRSI